ncbi:MAG: hypothetical protein HY905_24320 [Deltaproteobacteria bacterium]|nr:hypothetical protein [Deltaproteobacteria bacterium]
MRRTSFWAVLAVMSCATASGADATRAADGTTTAAAATRAAVATPATPARVTRVAMFKNGYGFVFRQVAVRGGTTVHVDGAPRAVLGTLWAYPVEGDVTVRGFRAVEGKGTEDRDCAALPDLLRSSIGKRVRLSRTAENGSQSYVGTVERAVGDDLFLLRTESSACTDGEGAVCAAPAGGADGGLLAFSTAQFDSIVFVDAPPEQCTAEVERAQLVIDVGGSGDGIIEYTALEQGLKWVPEYRIERLDDEKVRVTLQGALVNDVVDLASADIDLVVGVPHYWMSGTLSPLVIEGALEDVVEAGYYRVNDRFSGREWNSNAWASNVMQTQMAMPYDAGQQSGGAGDVQADLGGVSTADADELSLYRVEDVTLGKGERALVRVFSVEVPVEDIYKWEIGGTEAEATAVLQQAASGDPNALERVSRQRVWHHLRLDNRSDQPWTTGPAVYFADGNVVAQDRIVYTPAGARVDLRLTQATDILVSWDDVEDRRDRAAREIDDIYWDLIQGHGELSVRSHEDEDIELVVVRRMMGTISEPSDSGDVHAEPGSSSSWSPYLAWSTDPYASDYGAAYYDWNSTRVNSPTWCEWKITLRKDQEKKLTYQFRYYTR